MRFLSDYHIHTTYSDGKEGPEKYIEQARKLGIEEIGFSEHLTLTGELQQWAMDPMRISEYADHILGLQARYSDIKIRLGLEVDYMPGIEERIGKTVAGIPFDYLIGSVHYLGERTVDFGPEFYQGKNIGNIWDQYFGMLIRAVECRLFDFIAHADLVRIFGFFPASDRTSLYRDLAIALKENDVAIEINTNGRNKPIGDFYPDRDYLKIFHDAGVALCVNSDAHTPERVGEHFEEAYNLALDRGWREMARWSNRRRYLTTIPSMKPSGVQ